MTAIPDDRRPRRVGASPTREAFEVPRRGHLYERIGVLHDSKHPKPPRQFPVGIDHVIRPGGPTPVKRPSRDGSEDWCFSCDTLLERGTRTALCANCRRERKRLKQLHSRRHAREEFAITRAEVQALRDRGEALAKSIGFLTVVYNNEPAHVLKGRIDETMLETKRLLSALARHLPKVD